MTNNCNMRSAHNVVAISVHNCADPVWALICTLLCQNAHRIAGHFVPSSVRFSICKRERAAQSRAICPLRIDGEIRMAGRQRRTEAGCGEEPEGTRRLPARLRPCKCNLCRCIPICPLVRECVSSIGQVNKSSRASCSPRTARMWGKEKLARAKRTNWIYSLTNVFKKKFTLLIDIIQL